MGATPTRLQWIQRSTHGPRGHEAFQGSKFNGQNWPVERVVFFHISGRWFWVKPLTWIIFVSGMAWAKLRYLSTVLIRPSKFEHGKKNGMFRNRTLGYPMMFVFQPFFHAVHFYLIHFRGTYAARKQVIIYEHWGNPEKICFCDARKHRLFTQHVSRCNTCTCLGKTNALSTNNKTSFYDWYGHRFPRTAMGQTCQHCEHRRTQYTATKITQILARKSLR